MKWLPAWLVPMAVALSLGIAGGTLFNAINGPMPWTLGAMFANMVAAMLGVKARIPPLFMIAMMGVLGVMSGSSFGPEFVNRLPDWAVSMTIVMIFVFACAGLTYWMLRRFFGYSMLNAYFCSSPGGLTLMSVVGQSLGGDVRDIALVHSTRLALSLVAISSWLTLTGHPPIDVLGPTPGYSISLADAGMLIGCIVVGAWLAERFHVDGGTFIGPLILSAAIHMAGFTHANAPTALAAVAQVTLGSNIGSPIGGITVRRIVSTVGIGSLTAVIALGLCVLLTILLAGPLQIDSAALLISLAPAGFPLMVLVSVALNLDTAFVTVHQLARVVIIIFVGPPLIRYIARKSGLTLRDTTFD